MRGTTVWGGRRRAPLFDEEPRDVRAPTLLQSVSSITAPWLTLDRVLQYSLETAPPPAFRPAVPDMKEAVLVPQQVSEAEAEQKLECHICYGEMARGATYVVTSCCRREDNVKRMHLMCAVHCLRRSELCPFCKSAKVSFQ